MSLKSILAVASGKPEDEAVLTAAVRLAGLFAANVTVIPAFADPSADLVYYGAGLRRAPSEALARLAEAEQKEQEELQGRVARVIARETVAGGAITVTKRELQPLLAVANHSVVADLVMMGGDAAKLGLLSGLFAETLLSVRAPVLLVKDAPSLWDKIAIAWDGSAQAGRAVRAALPILRHASRVDILSNVDDRARDDVVAVALQPYLEAHGVREVVQRDIKGKDAAASLLAAARASGCQLLVAGGYGRPRFYELMLGGATQAFVNAEGAPHILLAH